MLHDIMNICHLMVHTKQVVDTRVSGRVGMPRGQGLMMVVLQRVGFISKTILGSTRGFLIKISPNFISLVMIGCLTLSPKREEVLAH